MVCADSLPVCAGQCPRRVLLAFVQRSRRFHLHAGGSLFAGFVRLLHGFPWRTLPSETSGEQLTSFYLLVAAGGALGGIFVAVVAPLLFRDFYELHWGISVALCFILWFVAPPLMATKGTPFWKAWKLRACTLPLPVVVGLVWILHHWLVQFRAATTPQVFGWKSGRPFFWCHFPRLARARELENVHSLAPIDLWLVVLGIAGPSAALWVQAAGDLAEKLITHRNFYGVLTLYEHRPNEPDRHHFLLQHGRITHGLQFVDSGLARQPTTYYAESSA